MTLRLGAVLVILAAAPAFARSVGGVYTAAKLGCSSGAGCHVPGETLGQATTEVCVTYDAAKTAGNLEVKIKSLHLPPHPFPLSGNENGFAVEVSNGSLSGGSDILIRPDNSRAATHHSSGTAQDHWTLTWTPPASESATVWFAGNAVNGDGFQTGDLSNRGSLSLSAGTSAEKCTEVPAGSVY